MKSNAYYRARIAIIESELFQREKDSLEWRLLANGLFPYGENKQKEIQGIEEWSIHFSDEPLLFSELARFNTWFAMHPEKIAGVEQPTSSTFFPVTTKGSKQAVIDTIRLGLQPKQNTKKIKIAQAKATAQAQRIRILSL